MIVYQSNKKRFLLNVADECIEDIIRDTVKAKLNMKVGESEYNSWKGSLNYMYHVLNNVDIPDDAGVAIEYRIPQTSKRIDFFLTGQNEDGIDHAILIELKQWQEVSITDKDALILTRFKQGISEEPHPSYQAWSYSTFLSGFNEVVYNEDIRLKPCAYLHNHTDNQTITNKFYSEYLEKAPAFCKGEKAKLQEFIKKYVRKGDKNNIIFRIENGKIKPSKALADSIVKMLKGNKEFVMIDDQKIVYENALALANHSSAGNKNVLIVEGGPGTGKSVVAINLLVALTKKGLLSHFVSKNAAPRAVYQSKLTGTLRQTEISNLFKGSGAFVSGEKNTFDALIVDEAHRLNEKSGMYGNLGDNQVREIIRVSKFAIFFIDEDQKVTLKDIGTKEEIKKWARKEGAKIHELELSSQFRCNGSDGYLAWLDHVLQIRETANNTLGGIDYDFKVFSSPTKLRDAIIKKNKIDNKSRLVAGYCWPWTSRKNPKAYDVVIPEFDFQMKWNLDKDGSLWIISPDSINEIGCIHTCQGLEVNYIGVIVGSDLIYKEGKVLTNPAARDKHDSTVKGYKKLIENNSEAGKEKVRAIIKNTYRTLMTRGMKGCYVYFTDKETEKYFSSMIG